MDENQDADKAQFAKEIINGDKVVTIVVQEIDDGMWELSILGKNNQATTWNEWFDTSQKAMDAGQMIILEEGIDEFYSSPDFEYI